MSASSRYKEKLDQAMQHLESGIESIMTSEGFQQWLKTLSQFHNYSARNVMLIYAQRPNATRVAGYRKWQAMGRQVKKGSEGIGIYAPLMAKEVDEQTGEEKRVLRGFKVVPVFDYMDTYGEPLPSGPSEVFLHGSSDVAERILPVIQGILIRNDLRYERQDIAPTRGLFNPLKKLIVTDVSLEPDMEMKTLVHELTHFLAGHGVNYAKYQLEREEIESITESATFAILHYFGFDSSEVSFNYVAGWAQDMELVMRNLEVIQKLAQQVIEEIEGEMTRRLEKESHARDPVLAA